MVDQHGKAIEKLTRLHKDNPVNIALIICGSLAAGTARADSDVDLYLVVTDAEFARVSQGKSWFYGSWDPEEFFGVEIDGKIIGMNFLRQAVTNASEPTRASFQDAYTVFSHNTEVQDLIRKIAVYPLWDRDKRIKAFYGCTRHYRYVGEAAFKSGDGFLIRHCLMELVFFAARLVLAHNKVLYPCHKALFKALEKCRELPDGFMTESRRLLKEENAESMIAYYDKTAGYFAAYAYPDAERIGYILENEWTWYTKKLTISEW